MKALKRTIILIGFLLFACFSMAHSSTADKIIDDLNNEDWIIRSRALDKIMQITPGVGREIREQYKYNYELKEALYNLLVKESERAQLSGGENVAEYQLMLVSAVASFGDERAIPLFLGRYYCFNSDIVRYLSKVDMAKIENELFENLENKNYPGRRICSLRIIENKLKLNNFNKNDKDKIKKKILISINDKNFSVRMWSLRAMSHYQDTEIISKIEKLAKSDGYVITRGKKTGEIVKKYPIRELALQILREKENKKDSVQ
jgi:hypothetical protein